MTRLERIEAARDKAAQLVALHGEQFLPFFIRAEELVHQEREGQSALDRALEIARKARVGNA
ncbi:hypothetical protein [Aliiroseovarius crassostreae]|uniref:hypothetical protein n=1 Tax=Aliiroseovarius crassostreae TaxID=154981 RepID=UPI0021FCAC0C|nr:hypothetical protein [Aliiroseovarius crassostreae]UWQ05943.1 hypothetical protein K3X22_05800 [Aliiroseovarius crassostreae]